MALARRLLYAHPMDKRANEIEVLRQLAERLRQAAAAVEGGAKRTSKRTDSLAVTRPLRRETPNASVRRGVSRSDGSGESVSPLS